MEYTQEIFDRQTGEMLTISTGNWITITELGALLGEGPRTARSILLKMEFLQIEGVATHSRHRLCTWVVERGYGKRIQANRSRPFDVVGPEGQAWVSARWSKVVGEVEAAKSDVSRQAAGALHAYRETRLTPLPVEAMVWWVRDHFQVLTQAEIASVLSITQPLVQRYLQRRSDQRAKLQRSKSAALQVKPKPLFRVDASQRQNASESW